MPMEQTNDCEIINPETVKNKDVISSKKTYEFLFFFYLPSLQFGDSSVAISNNILYCHSKGMFYIKNAHKRR